MANVPNTIIFHLDSDGFYVGIPSVYARYFVSLDKISDVCTSFPIENNKKEELAAIYGRDVRYLSWTSFKIQDKMKRLVIDLVENNAKVLDKHVTIISNDALKRFISENGEIEISDMNKDLFSHQKTGVEYLARNRGGALFWETGVGKTAPAIEFSRLGFKSGKIFSTLVICPKTIMKNWERHIKRWFPESEVEIISDAKYGNSADKIAYALSHGMMNNILKDSHKFLILSYGVFSRVKDIKKLSKYIINIDHLILDEVHRLKDSESKRTQNIRKICSCRYITILTGTAIAKGYADVYNEMKIINSAPFGYISERSFVAANTYGYYNNIVWVNEKELSEWVGQNASCLRKVDCLDLPDKIEDVVLLDMSPEMEKLYRFLQESVIAKIKSLPTDKPLVVRITNILTLIRRLMQLCGGFIYATETYDFSLQNAKYIFAKLLSGEIKDSEIEEIVRAINIQEELKITNPKYDWVLEKLESDDDKYVIYAQHIAEILYLESLINRIGRSVRTLYGQTPDKERYKIWHDEFQDGDLQTLIIHPRAGGEGIDLFASNKAIYFTLDYSYISYKQSMDRLHRPGQKYNVTYYLPLFEGTIEQTIYNVLKERTNMADYVMKVGADEFIKLISKYE